MTSGIGTATTLRRHLVLVVLAIVAGALTACAPQVAAPPEPAKGAPPDFPEAYYRQLRAEGKPVYHVDPSRSLVTIEVRRGGSFSKFGHDHVVASHTVEGSIAPDEGRADLYASLGELVVDEPALRAAAGFDTHPEPEDIEATRRNMLVRVLETDRYPYASIGVKGVSAGAGDEQVRINVTLHGTTRTVDAAARLERSANELSVTGTFVIDQTDFAIAPLSVLNGAITVQDRVKVAFQVRARVQQ